MPAKLFLAVLFNGVEESIAFLPSAKNFASEKTLRKIFRLFMRTPPTFEEMKNGRAIPFAKFAKCPPSQNLLRPNRSRFSKRHSDKMFRPSNQFGRPCRGLESIARWL